MHLSPLHEPMGRVTKRGLLHSLFRSAPRTAAARVKDDAKQGGAGKGARCAPSVAEGLERFDYDGSDLNDPIVHCCAPEHFPFIWYPAAEKAIGPIRPIGPIPLVKVGPGGDFTRDDPDSVGRPGVIVVYAAVALLFWFWLLPLLMGTEPITKP